MRGHLQCSLQSLRVVIIRILFFPPFIHNIVIKEYSLCVLIVLIQHICWNCLKYQFLKTIYLHASHALIILTSPNIVHLIHTSNVPGILFTQRISIAPYKRYLKRVCCNIRVFLLNYYQNTKISIYIKAPTISPYRTFCINFCIFLAVICFFLTIGWYYPSMSLVRDLHHSLLPST